MAADLAKEVLLDKKAQQVSYRDVHLLNERCLIIWDRQDNVAVVFHLPLLPTEPDSLCLRLSSRLQPSKNILRGLEAARKSQAKTIGLCGQKGQMKNYCDIVLSVPNDETSLIQEMHISIGHLLCLLVEEDLFG